MLTALRFASILPLLLLVAGCDGITSSASGEGGAASCAWPLYLTPDSGLPGDESGVCVAHRYFFRCQSAQGGLNGFCVGDAPDAAASPECQLNGPGFTCESTGCAADEYVVLCNSFQATAPSGLSCHSMTADPEQEYFCCDCATRGP